MDLHLQRHIAELQTWALKRFQGTRFYFCTLVTVTSYSDCYNLDLTRKISSQKWTQYQALAKHVCSFSCLVPLIDSMMKMKIVKIVVVDFTHFTSCLFMCRSSIYKRAISKRNNIWTTTFFFELARQHPQKKTSALPGVFLTRGHQIVKKSSKLYLKTPKWWYRNHSFGDKLTKSGNTAKWSRIYNISKAPPLCEKWNLYRWKFKDLQVLKLSKQI